MALVQANGVAVLRGTINRPQRGVWTADLVIDQPDGSGFAVGTKVTITTDAGLRLVGVVAPNRSGSFLDSVHVRVVGGAGGLTKAATARAYVQPGAFVRDVVNGLVADSGEQLSSSTDAGFLNTNLAAWTVMSQTVKRALDNLVEVVDDSLTWRILEGGTLWVGAESWPTVSAPDAVSMQFDPANNLYVIGEDAPSIAPGTNVDGIGNVGRVEHHIEPDSIRTVAYVASDVERGFKAHIKKLVDAQLARRGIDYTKRYQAKVITQSGDFSTVDVKPVNPALPGLSKVPVMWGIPGVTAQIAPGDLVMIGFDSADPSKPYACDWQPAATTIQLNITATTIDIKANGNATVEATGTATLKGAASTTLGSVGTFPVLTSPNAVDSLGVPVSLITPTTVLAG
jgi:hypothetical protein